ncbi:MAG TPA: response regulator transcription factor [Bacteroidales bacterium]|nr:response regulator transcription factor [Bacteroidales bacterium]HSA44633.1 response regulator transcription factor [Bacteroidales bacterium]
MEEEISLLYRQYLELLASIPFREEDLDYTLFEHHLHFLRMLDVMEHSAVTVFDLYRKEHIYISRKYESLLGYDVAQAENEGNAFFDSKIHPEDLRLLLREGIVFLRYGLEASREEMKTHKLISDYRVLNARGVYVRVIEQKMVMELDPSGYPWLTLCLLDISPDQDLDRPCRNCLINLQNGDIFTFRDFNPDEDSLLTKRETEILHLISKGFVSKQIADRLFISVNTVNTHRQRIIEKMNVPNTQAAISYARRAGLLGFIPD